jgi:transcriptional regulator with XRE-family HTH domain
MQNITPEQLYKTISKNVAKYRKEKGLSQLDLSLQMGYKSVSVVSGAEISTMANTLT